MRAPALVAAALLAGCGYAAVNGGGGSALRIPPVHNRTAQAEAGGLVQAALRARFAAVHRLADDGSNAPVLSSELMAVRTLLAASAAGGASSYRLEAELRLRAPGYDDAVVLSENYLRGVDVLGTEANRRAALHRLAERLADEAYERLTVAERFGQR